MSHLRAVPDGPTGPRESTVPPRSGSASSVRVEAPGKVNLFLSVGAPGPDGYHPLTTVFQAVRLIETVTARRQSAQDHGTVTLTLEEPDADVPVDESNLAVRAATLLAQATGVSEGVDLLLRKRVPVAGGMAGGSADAAAALVACNALWGTGLSLPELSALAARLGADVPFPLTGATAVGSGRGDLVTPIMTRGAYHWVFALAEEGLSTPAVFRRFDELTAIDELCDFVRENCPSVQRAADCRRFSCLCQTLLAIPPEDARYRGRAEAIFAELCRLRWRVLSDPRARMKNRGAAALTLLGERGFRRCAAARG